MGRECYISSMGPAGPISTVEVYKLEESEKEDTMFVGVRSTEAGTQQKRQLQECELPRVLNLAKQKSEQVK